MKSIHYLMRKKLFIASKMVGRWENLNNTQLNKSLAVSYWNNKFISVNNCFMEQSICYKMAFVSRKSIYYLLRTKEMYQKWWRRRATPNTLQPNEIARSALMLLI